MCRGRCRENYLQTIRNHRSWHAWPFMGRCIVHYEGTGRRRTQKRTSTGAVLRMAQPSPAAPFCSVPPGCRRPLALRNGSKERSCSRRLSRNSTSLLNLKRKLILRKHIPAVGWGNVLKRVLERILAIRPVWAFFGLLWVCAVGCFRGLTIAASRQAFNSSQGPVHSSTEPRLPARMRVYNNALPLQGVLSGNEPPWNSLGLQM